MKRLTSSPNMNFVQVFFQVDRLFTNNFYKKFQAFNDDKRNKPI